MVPPLLDVDGPSSSSDVPRHHRSDGEIASKKELTVADGRVEDSNDVAVAFSHVHLYADSVEDVESYKDLEDRLNALSVGIEGGYNRGEGGASGDRKLDVKSCRSIWRSICGSGSDEAEDNKANAEVVEEETFVPQNRDVVKQLLSGLGFRVTGKRFGPNTRSVLVTSRDPKGVQIVVTARADAQSAIADAREIEEGEGTAGARKEGEEEHLHFDAANVDTFLSSHSDRQGVAVLAFEVTAGSISSIHSRYLQSHPLLLPSEYTRGPVRYDDGRADVLEVYAYYRGEKRDSTADVGTRLRFVQRIDGGGSAGNGAESMAGSCILPGLERVEATFDAGSKAAYCDHWVSNVVSRTGFLDTLRETLGFTPKVDFNAGVVAAGEAQIESTVTGNDPTTASAAVPSTSDIVSTASTGNGGGEDYKGALTDQTQVYLPINNALSEVGHVHGFLRELGQGVQHVASRVDDLVSFVQRGNDYRKITGEGFTFLNIPRSYYGVLSVDSFLPRGDDGQALSAPCAAAVVGACEKSGIMSGAGEVDLDATAEDVGRVLDELLPQEHHEEYKSNKEVIVTAVLRSRYANLRRLLGRHLSDESYMGIVRNQILVDVQGEDLLFQIFTCNVLQRNAGDEAPFFEFIQRVCSECLGPDGCPLPVKPGCGGFGIRNFLTLFLSIEVSKAMLDAVRFKSEGNDFATSIAQRRVQLFTDQLNESNPILTSISDAMTAEGKAEAAMNAAMARRKNGDADRAADSEAEVDMWRERLAAAGRAKGEGNERLMKCSAKYNGLMRELREEEEETLRGKK